MTTRHLKIESFRDLAQAIVLFSEPFDESDFDIIGEATLERARDNSTTFTLTATWPVKKGKSHGKSQRPVRRRAR